MPQSFPKWVIILLKIGAVSTLGFLGFIVLGTLLNWLSYRNETIPSAMFPIPSAECIGRGYFQAVIQKKHNYIAEDQDCIHRKLLDEITQYGGAEVRNVAVFSESLLGNSDHQFEATTIKFEYRHSPTLLWQSGAIGLMTTTNLLRNNSLIDALPFRRIYCGGEGF